MMHGTVVAVAQDDVHAFSKPVVDEIRIEVGVGVVGDAHAGTTVQHRSRVRRDPSQPNLRQVHLLHQELLDEVNAAGFSVAPGDLGENITTAGIPLLDLPQGALVHIGDSVILRVTGLRNPCSQIEDYQPGLLAQMVRKRDDGTIERRAGVMSVVEADGSVSAGDPIRIELPAGERLPLEPV